MKDIGIIAVGGYNEVGRNMTAIKIGKDIVVMDMGIRLDQGPDSRGYRCRVTSRFRPDRHGGHPR